MLRIATIDERPSWAEAAKVQFCWYYADVCDSKGNGLVINWASGLPFLAGSRSSRGHSNVASLNIVLYRPAGLSAYWLDEKPLSEVHFDPASGRATFGESSMTLRAEGGESRLSVLLDVTLPDRSRFSGTVDIQGKTVQSDLSRADSVGSAPHIWCPQLGHAEGEVSVTVGDEALHFRGPGYVDSNLSRQPLHEQGIERWDWGRVSFSAFTLVYYWTVPEGALEPFCVLILMHPDGKSEQIGAELERSEVSTSPYLVETARRLKFRTARGVFTVDLKRPRDRSPFYERYSAEGTGPGGEKGVGFAEVVLPSRVDQPWMRPFIRMRTHSSLRKNSPFLPLFSGSSAAPLTRLYRAMGLGKAHG